MLGWHRLTLKINADAEIDDLADGPAQHDSHNPAKDAHRSGLGEEEFSYVRIAGANRLHDADFASTFQNRHDQRIDDSDGSDCQREATENSKECVQDPKDLPQAIACVENRE